MVKKRFSPYVEKGKSFLNEYRSVMQYDKVSRMYVPRDRPSAERDFTTVRHGQHREIERQAEHTENNLRYLHNRTSNNNTKANALGEGIFDAFNIAQIQVLYQ